LIIHNLLDSCGLNLNQVMTKTMTKKSCDSLFYLLCKYPHKNWDWDYIAHNIDINWNFTQEDHKNHSWIQDRYLPLVGKKCSVEYIPRIHMVKHTDHCMNTIKFNYSKPEKTKFHIQDDFKHSEMQVQNNWNFYDDFLSIEELDYDSEQSDSYDEDEYDEFLDYYDAINPKNTYKYIEVNIDVLPFKHLSYNCFHTQNQLNKQNYIKTFVYLNAIVNQYQLPPIFINLVSGFLFY